MRSAKLYPRLSVVALMLAAAMMVTLSCRTATPVEAAVAVGDACTAEYTDVDFTITGADRKSDTTVHTVIEGRIHGDSMHQTSRYKDQPPGYEEIRVDRRWYVRETGQNGQWGSWEEIEILTPPASSSTRSDEDTTAKSIDPPTPTFCGSWDPADVQFLGTVTIGDDNTSVKHYIAEADHTVIGGIPGTFENWEFWIDSAGRLVQARQEYLRPRGGGFPEHHVDVTFTLSGHGEPNVITAPVIPQE